jgi:hypothetical protein
VLQTRRGDEKGTIEIDGYLIEERLLERGFHINGEYYPVLVKEKPCV